jgi:hypothetical protein
VKAIHDHPRHFPGSMIEREYVNDN